MCSAVCTAAVAVMFQQWPNCERQQEGMEGAVAEGAGGGCNAERLRRAVGRRGPGRRKADRRYLRGRKPHFLLLTLLMQLSSRPAASSQDNGNRPRRTLFDRAVTYIQGDPSPGGLGSVDLDLGCSTILLGQ